MMRFTKVRRSFERPRIRDVAGHVSERLEPFRERIRPGGSIAIGVGSRGIANIEQIARAVAGWVKGAGGKPFIIPAMGSHGGATAQGQAEVLASYGISEESMGCPVRSCMDVVELPNEGLENRVFMDRSAWESDGVIVINRVKPHTDFHGPFESGLVKMAVIGLGKERQAFELHRFGVRGLRELIPRTAERVLATGKILFGVGIVENSCDETALVEVIAGHSIMEREPKLLDAARKHMPRLPVEELDVLIIDRIGKDVSGAGMDTNIIGRIAIAGEPEPVSPRIKSIMVRDLTEASHGNATGVGLADVVTEQLRMKVDFEATYRNIVTSGFLERGKLPVVAATDEEALEIALRGAGVIDTAQARIVRILDTLHLSELAVSDRVRHEMEGRENVEWMVETTDIFSVDLIGELGVP